MAKKIMRRFKLCEISAVTKPAQEPARAVIMKSAPETTEANADFVKNAFIAARKLAETPDSSEPLSFADAYAQQVKEQAAQEVSEKLWPMYWALRASLDSLIASSALSNVDRLSAIHQSIRQFAEAVDAALPELKAEVVDEYGKAIESLEAAIAAAKQEKQGMTLEQALAKIAELEKTLGDATAALKASEANADDLGKKLEAATAEAAEAKKSAEIAKSDETITVEGQELRKSEIGAPVFAVMKAQAERLEKAELAKLADSLIPNLPGDEATKVEVLKAVNAIKSDDVRKAALDMLKSGSEGNAKLLKEAGRTTPGGGGQSAAEKMEARAAEIAKADGIGHDRALAKLLKTEEGRKLQADADAERAAAH